MATDYKKTPLGERLAYYRKLRGFKTPQALADAIPDGKVSRATIVNIEAGRKADPSISDLIALSYGLAISPLALLFDFENLFEPTDMPELLVGEWAELSAFSVLEIFTFGVRLFETHELLQDPAYQFGLVRSIRGSMARSRRLKKHIAKLHALPPERVDNRVAAELRAAESQAKATDELIQLFMRTAPVSGMNLPSNTDEILLPGFDSRTNWDTADGEPDDSAAWPD